MPRVAALLLVALALLIYGTPGLAQRPPMQHPYTPPQQAPPQQPPVQQPQPQQPQFQQKQPQAQMQQMTFEQRRALQLPGTLVIERAGLTAGRIAGGPSQAPIDCGSQCEYRHGSNPPLPIRLVLIHDPGTAPGDLTRALEGHMIQWSGTCSGYFWHCDVPMKADDKHRVIVTIGKPRLTIRMQGSDSITDDRGPACPGGARDCIREFQPVATQGPEYRRMPPVVTLRDPSPAPRIWTGCDANTGGVSPECKMTVTLASEVNVRFQVVLRTITIHKTGNGVGDVLTSPAPVGRCTAQQQAAAAAPCTVFEQGTDLTLTANGQFGQWGPGPCNGQTSPTCRFTVGADTAVSAFYRRPQ